jgi:ubiquinone/menaquinone biosynthesis C-methylase UbiE
MSHPLQSDASRPDIAHFSAVDETDVPNQLIAFLDVAKAAPGMVAAKEEMLEWLEPERASSGLDVGCGYGADVVALAERMGRDGRATGVDVSDTMIAEARRRTAGIRCDLSFEIGDAHVLPFENDTFDVCRIETVLQHLAEPHRAVTEMVRVTRTGGRVAAFEFDQATLFMDHPDVELAEVIRATLTSAITQGTIGRQVPRLFVEAGLTDVRATPRVISQDPSFFRLMLGRPVTELLDAGVITSERADNWWAAIHAAAAAGHFTNGATAFVVCGVVQ